MEVRSAQLIGGALSVRKRNRQKINALYRLRNRATHGSRLQERDMSKQQIIVQECLELYRELVQMFLALGGEPDWSSLELEPRPPAR